MTRRFRWLLQCLLTLCFHANLAARAETVVIDVHAEALLDHSRVVLADLATVSAATPELVQAFGALPVGAAPLAGHLDRRSRAELDVLVRGLALAQELNIEWRGAGSVLIRTESQPVDANQLTAVARHYVLDTFSAAYAALDVTVAAQPPELSVPVGALQYRARAVDAARLRARMPVWVDVLVDGMVYRSAVLTLNVSARQNVYVARRALAGDSVTTPEDYLVRQEEVTGLQDAAVPPGELGGGRLRAALAEGQVLTRKQLVPEGMVLRGDRLRLLSSGGGIAIETVAYAQTDAAQGQLVRVLPEHGREAVMVRVVAPGVVSFDGR